MRPHVAFVLPSLTAIVALWCAGTLSLRVDEPQFAYRYSRIAFVLGVGAILCVVSALGATLWALFFRAASDTRKER